MKKVLIPLILLSFWNHDLFAQHCPWDGSSFIMADVHTNPGIKLQKIYLLDSNGSRVTSRHYYGQDKFDTDTAIFWKNNPPAGKNTKWNYIGQYFSFAKNYQVLSFGQYDIAMKYSLLIFYDMGKKRLSKILPLPNENIHVLCTLNKELWRGKGTPFIVSL